jgi:predicted esterase
MMESKIPSGLEESSSTSRETASGKQSVQDYPAPYVVEPTSPHTHTAILLHGLGSNGSAFGSFFLTASVTSNEEGSASSRPLNVLYPSMKWIFPSASWRRSTRFKGMKLSSWFDIVSVQNPSLREDTQIEGLVQSSQYLRDLICEEVQKLNDSWGGGEGAERRIVFGGLSQGCAISLVTLLSLDHSLGGWVGMSGFMPLRGMLEEALKAEVQGSEDGIVFQDDDAEHDTSDIERHEDNQKGAETKALHAFRQDILDVPVSNPGGPANVLETPLFYGHGSDDEKVACRLGDELVETLKKLNMDIRHQVYPGLGHWIQAPEEIDDMISVFTKSGAWPDRLDRKTAA